MQEERTCWEKGETFCFNPDTTLFYRSLLPKQPRFILIMIHGAGQHSGQFWELGCYCYQHEVAFYALDLRGFGQSSGKRGHVQRFHQYLEDLHHFVQYVRQRHPHQPLFLLGHSFGGTVVIRYGQERAKDIRGVVLSAPALKLRLPVPPVLYLACHVGSWIVPEWGIELNRLARWADRLSASIPGLKGTERLQNMLYGRKGDEDPYAHSLITFRWMSELLNNGRQALLRVREFRFAALCLCGGDDPVVDPVAVKKFHDGLPTSDKKWILLPHVKHRVLQDPESDSIYAQMIGWLQERCNF